MDVRILSGTHKDLKRPWPRGASAKTCSTASTWCRMRVPALRERQEDIPLLVQFLMRRTRERNNMREKPIDDDVIEELRAP